MEKFELTALEPDGQTPDVAHQARLCMNALDRWIADATKKLIGRAIVRTGINDPWYGRASRVDAVTVEQGPSGYHMVVRVEAPAVAAAQYEWLELGRTCELLPAETTLSGEFVG